MKRWTTILGRGGTTLIAISLALLLVSLIPQINLISYRGGTSVSPEQVSTTPSQVLNPQQELQLAVTVNGTLKIYLLEINIEFEFSPDTGFEYRFNATDLQELLQEHPDQVIWQHEVENGDYKRSYTPTRVMNATVAFYNPSDSETAYVDYEGALKMGLAPGDKVRTIAYFAAPIGIILTMPWLVNIWKQRKQS
jgi:hypothetical protein